MLVDSYFIPLFCTLIIQTNNCPTLKQLVCKMRTEAPSILPTKYNATVINKKKKKNKPTKKSCSNK